MKALIFNNEVVQTSDKEFPVSNEMIWMDAPINCKAGWVLVDGVIQEKPKPDLTPEQLKEQYTNALQDTIDRKVQEKNYRDGYACASYKDSIVESWAQEATDFIAWRDACWQYAIDIQSQVEQGQIQPPSIEDFINNAPQLIWSS